MDSLYNILLNRLYSSVPPLENIEPVFEFNFEKEFNPMEIGRHIESFYNLQIYCQNYKYILYRLQCRKIYNGTLKIEAYSHRGEILSMIRTNPDIAFMAANGEMNMPKMFDRFVVNFDERELLRQYKLARQFFDAKYRCILKSRFNMTYPDVIIDDTIIDIKTSKSFQENKDHWTQLFNQYLDFAQVQNTKEIKYKDITAFDKKLIKYKVKKLGIYYWKFNKLYTVKIDKLFKKDEVSELIYNRNNNMSYL